MKLTKKMGVFVFMATASLLVFLYLIFTQIAIWNDCQTLQHQSSSMLITKLQRLHMYFLKMFYMTSPHLHQSKSTKWNHHNIVEVCNQDTLSIFIFILTSQLGHDAKLFFFTLCDMTTKIFLKILECCQSVAICCIEQKNIVCIVVLLIFCSVVIFYRKSRTAEKQLTPSRNYNNSSISLVSSRNDISRYESGFEKDLNQKSKENLISISSICYTIVRWILALTAFSIFLSIPWEFVRLYQKAVAHRAANVNMGLPSECTPNSLSWIDSVKSLLRWHLSWSHDHNPCTDYYHAILVDPLWEVNPLLVLSSVLSRGIVLPLEVISSSLGRSVRIFFAEIPAHWQPVIMLVSMVSLVAFLLVLCRYRVSIPLLLRIEPKTPVGSPVDAKSSNRESRMAATPTTKSHRNTIPSNRRKLTK